MWNLETLALAGLTVGVRVGTMAAFAPFLGAAVVPLKVRAGLVAALTLLLFPVYAPEQMSLASLNWAAFLMSEVTVGLLLGFSLHVVFEGARLAGQVLGFQAGFSLAHVFDPSSSAGSPVFSVFFQIFALLLFLQMDVHLWLVRGMAKSFEYVPPGTALSSGALVTRLAEVAGGMWLAAVQMAAPALAVLLLADLAMGFMAKASPQWPVLFAGVSVKSLLVFVVLGSAVLFWPTALEAQFTRAVGFGEQLLGLAR